MSHVTSILRPATFRLSSDKDGGLKCCESASGNKAAIMETEAEQSCWQTCCVPRHRRVFKWCEKSVCGFCVRHLHPDTRHQG